MENFLDKTFQKLEKPLKKPANNWKTFRLFKKFWYELEKPEKYRTILGKKKFFYFQKNSHFKNELLKKMKKVEKTSKLKNLKKFEKLMKLKKLQKLEKKFKNFENFEKLKNNFIELQKLEKLLKNFFEKLQNLKKLQVFFKRKNQASKTFEKIEKLLKNFIENFKNSFKKLQKLQFSKNFQTWKNFRNTWKNLKTRKKIWKKLDFLNNF